MNETVAEQPSFQDGHEELPVRGSTTRRQLILASLFPLALFGLLSILVTASALYEQTLRLALQRNTAQVQLVASSLVGIETSSASHVQSNLQGALRVLKPENGSQFYLVDPVGNLVAGSEIATMGIPLPGVGLQSIIQSRQPGSQLIDLSNPTGEAIVSYAPLTASNLELIFVEPWARIMAPAFYYQLVLGGLIVLGIIFSLYMLSLSLGRIIRPINILAENASRAVPGALFHPMAEDGPLEVRTLIKAFNLMVIRLAEQQTTLRQFAHKALLSQEEERQRLSHELHDGTVQDLVALSQRVELCRSELERDPELVRHRLDELHKLVERTLSDVRSISNALRPSILEDLGLAVAIKTLCTDLENQMPSVQCSYTISGVERRLSPDLELAIFRVVQEALVNIRKHASSATHVEVGLAFENLEVKTVVRNDGPALQEPDVRSLVRTGHLGLAGMYERARLFHGTLEIIPGQEGGSEVKLRLPYLPEPAAAISNP